MTRKIGKILDDYVNKKIVIGIIVVILIFLGIGSYYLLSNKNNQKDNNDTNINDNKSNDVLNNSNNTTDKKILVVYYSATGSTKKVAYEIANSLNADIFEIEPKDIYTSDDLDWTNSNSRVSREHNDESLRNIELKNTKVDNWNSYDTVLIGYPIWWGIAAWPVDNFVKDNDFTGKTVIPFCTSASSGLGNSGKLLEKETNTGTWQEGIRFSSRSSYDDIESFINDIKNY